jgi:general secretion pathway protein E
MNPDDTHADASDEAGECRRLAGVHGLPFVEQVTDDMLDPDLVSDLPVEWARTRGLLPVRIDGRPCVLTSDPLQVDHHQDVAVLVGEELAPVVAPPDVVASSIERCYYRRERSTRDVLEQMDAQGAPGAVPAARADDLLAVAQEAPVTQLVNVILLGALKQGASDIHFEPFESRLCVRYRIDGVLYEQESPPKHLEQALVSRLKVMARMDIAERRLPQDGMARVRVGDREIDIRVATVPVAEGERVVLRLLQRDAALLSLAELGLAPEEQARFESLLALPYGMLVACGPTGAGKTTTLYAALSRLDAGRKNILTIEDPIEYQLPSIGQIQVKPKIGLSFANGLRHVLRQDPDVILVGEIRDAETADIAIRASLTGHLVFTTLHTNDAPGAVLRLVDMGVEPFLLASCLRAVLAQRLVRRLCAACRRRVTLDATATARYADVLPGLREGQEVWEPAGCDACLEGYRGRVGLFELLVIDAAMRDDVRGGFGGSVELRQRAEQRGMRGLISDGVSKALAGMTTLDEVYNVAGTVR